MRVKPTPPWPFRCTVGFPKAPQTCRGPGRCFRWSLTLSQMRQSFNVRSWLSYTLLSHYSVSVNKDFCQMIREEGSAAMIDHLSDYSRMYRSVFLVDWITWEVSVSGDILKNEQTKAKNIMSLFGIIVLFRYNNRLLSPFYILITRSMTSKINKLIHFVWKTITMPV